MSSCNCRSVASAIASGDCACWPCAQPSAWSARSCCPPSSALRGSRGPCCCCGAEPCTGSIPRALRSSASHTRTPSSPMPTPCSWWCIAPAASWVRASAAWPWIGGSRTGCWYSSAARHCCSLPLCCGGCATGAPEPAQSGVHQRRLDGDAGAQHGGDRRIGGNLVHDLLLRRGQGPAERHAALDVLAPLRIARPAHADRDLADGAVVLHRVPAECHRGVGFKARQQQLPRRKARIAATGSDRLIRRQVMVPRDDLLYVLVLIDHRDVGHVRSLPSAPAPRVPATGPPAGRARVARAYCGRCCRRSSRSHRPGGRARC